MLIVEHADQRCVAGQPPRRLDREWPCAFEFAQMRLAGGFRRIRQQLLIDMHDDLIAAGGVARCRFRPGEELRRDLAQRVGAPCADGMRVFRHRAFDIAGQFREIVGGRALLHRAVDRGANQLADLDRHAAVNDHRVVIVMPKIEKAMPLRRRGPARFLNALDPSILLHRALDMCRRAVECDVEQRGFVLRCRDPRHRPDLGIGNAALAKRGVDLRQFANRVGDPDLLAGRDDADAAVHVEPVRTAHDAGAAPAFGGVERGDELEEAVRGGRDLAPQFGDLLVERGHFHCS
jgi:hypothetical protein